MPFGHPPSPLVSQSRLPVRLREVLLGKSPLRLITERTLIAKNVWREKLECGHEVDAFLDYQWDERNQLIEFEPRAKRRRCRACKPAVAPVLKTRAEISAAAAQAELVHQRKLQFGSLFDKLCFANGEMRPGLSAEDVISIAPAPPKKPVQSVVLANREKKSKGEFCP